MINLKVPVLVEWHDACQPRSSWEDLDGLTSEPSYITSVGWIVQEDKKVISLAANIDKELTVVMGVTVIPRTAVKKIRCLTQKL
jgi:hypothetical protein